MPLTPSNGDRGAGPLVRLYKVVELALWKTIARILGLDGFGRRWLLRILSALPSFRKQVRRIVADAGDRAPALVQEAIERAWADGTAAARDDIGSRRAHTDDRRTRAIIDRVLEALDDVNRGLPRTAEQTVRRAAEEAVRDERVDDAGTHRRTLDRIMRREARRGFTGLIDQRGRRRELVAYVEAQIRGAISEAEIDGYMAQLVATGYDLFIVSDVPGACEVCRPFEGKVISITGSTAGAIARDNSTGRTVRVEVMCSLAEARARGLFHPNCRHTIRVWTPDNPAPPRAIRVSEAVRTRRRAAAAAQRSDRVTARVDAMTTGADPILARRLKERAARRTLTAQQIPPSPYDDARTPAEVGEILRQRHGFEVTGFDTKGVDLAVAQEYARALEDMIAEYPSARLDAVRIGEVPQDVAADPRYVLAFVRQAPDVLQNGGSTEMVLNLRFARSYALFLASKQGSENRGWHTPNSSRRPVYSTIVHEWAHVLDNQAQQRPRMNAVMALYNHFFNTHQLDPNLTFEQREALLSAWLHKLSGYSFRDGSVNPPEALAEAFTDVKNNGDNASAPAKVLYKLLMDELGGGAP
ncbi:phage minor capsid protein [Nocardia thailandica]|uniref:phage minor capsid protein n=1 Tax=Nocardia thailandica TaxID=257275 RepID=UPI0002DDD826|nr:phage minor capsid protein [Nocardia thailandica]